MNEDNRVTSVTIAGGDAPEPSWAGWGSERALKVVRMSSDCAVAAEPDDNWGLLGKGEPA